MSEERGGEGQCGPGWGASTAGVMGEHRVEQGRGPVCPPATPLGGMGGGGTPVWLTLKTFPPHFLFSHQQGMIFEKLGICSMPQFVRFMHDLVPLKEDPDVVVTDLRYGTIPVKLYQPKVSSCTPRLGIVFYHGGGMLLGSLSKSPSLRPPPVVGQRPSRAGWAPAFQREVTLPSPSWISLYAATGQGTIRGLTGPRTGWWQRYGMFGPLSGSEVTYIRKKYIYICIYIHSSGLDFS